MHCEMIIIVGYLLMSSLPKTSNFDVDLRHCLSASNDALDGHSSTSMWCWWIFEENGEFFMDLSRNCWGRARLNYWNWPFLRFPCCFRSTLTSAAGSLSIRTLWIITQLLMSWQCWSFEFNWGIIHGSFKTLLMVILRGYLIRLWIESIKFRNNAISSISPIKKILKTSGWNRTSLLDSRLSRTILMDAGPKWCEVWESACIMVSLLHNIVIYAMVIVWRD